MIDVSWFISGRKRTKIGNRNAAGRREKTRRKIGQSWVRKTRSTDLSQPEPKTQESQPILSLGLCLRPSPTTATQTSDQPRSYGSVEPTRDQPDGPIKLVCTPKKKLSAYPNKPRPNDSLGPVASAAHDLDHDPNLTATRASTRRYRTTWLAQLLPHVT